MQVILQERAGIDMYDYEKMISLSNWDDLKEFVDAASKCDFDIDLKYNRMFVDAKSMLGVLGIGIKKDFTVCYGGIDEKFETVIDKFASDKDNLIAM